MSFKNALMVEAMVPRHEDTPRRIHGFYDGIGWEHRDDTQSEFDTYVSPTNLRGVRPVISYWQTTNQEKINAFAFSEEENPSPFSKGLALPVMQQLVEVALVVPSDEDVHKIFDRGGRLLMSHAHVPPREHAGRQEFRFTDPFNYSWRVTADVGWQLQKPLEEMRLGVDIFTTTQASRMLGVSRLTLTKMIDRGELPSSFHVGRDRRITLDDIQRILAERGSK